MRILKGALVYKAGNLIQCIMFMEVMNFNEEEREAYESHLKWLRLEASTLKKFENKAREEGRAQGREEERALLIATMVEQGYDDEFIATLMKIGRSELTEWKAKLFN